MTSDYDKVKAILKEHNITDIEEIEYGGDCFDELMDWFADEMPYGVMKARTVIRVWRRVARRITMYLNN